MYSIWGEWHISSVASLEALLEYIYMEENGVFTVYTTDNKNKLTLYKVCIKNFNAEFEYLKNIIIKFRKPIT